MVLDPTALPAAVHAWLAARRYATLTTLRPDGTPHVVPVAMTVDADGTVRVLARRRSTKVRNVRAGSGAALCEVDGPRWLTLEGPAEVLEEPEAVADGERRYAGRFRAPTPNSERVVIVVTPTRAMGGGWD